MTSENPQSPPPHTPPETPSRLKTYRAWYEIAAAILLLIGGVVAFNGYVDWRISEKLSDEAVLRKIGMSARPFCIFNSKGSILFDSGAMQFIGYSGKDPIELADRGKDGAPQHVIMHFNRVFVYPPALTLIGQGLSTCEAKRGPGFDWIYTIYSASALVTESSGVAPPSDEQDYKLEILF